MRACSQHPQTDAHPPSHCRAWKLRTRCTQDAPLHSGALSNTEPLPRRRLMTSSCDGRRFSRTFLCYLKSSHRVHTHEVDFKNINSILIFLFKGGKRMSPCVCVCVHTCNCERLSKVRVKGRHSRQCQFRSIGGMYLQPDAKIVGCSDQLKTAQIQYI